MRLADRRTATRFEVLGELWGSIQAAEPLILRNLGREGALIESAAPLPVGSTHTIRLMRGTTATDVRAVVRHLSPVLQAAGPRRYLVGLEFVNLDEQAHVWISYMMDQQADRPVSDEA